MTEETILHMVDAPKEDAHPAPKPVQEQGSFYRRMRRYEAIKEALELI